MLLWIFRKTARVFRHYLITTGNPRHIAHGIALGLVLGLLPKTNLTAVALLASIFALHVHLGAALFSACVFSLAGPLLDPLLHRVGLEVLQSPPLNEFWRRLFQLPLAAWTALDNTVVVGALVVGAVCYLPAYWVGSRLSRRWLSDPGSHAEDKQADHDQQTQHDALTEMLALADADEAELEARLAVSKARAVRRLDDHGGPAPVIIEDSVRIVATYHAVASMEQAPEAATDHDELAAAEASGETPKNQEDEFPSGLSVATADVAHPRKTESAAPPLAAGCAAETSVRVENHEAADHGAQDNELADHTAGGHQADDDEPAILEMPHRASDEALEVINGKRAAAGYFRGA